jgi:hypothetical protein
MPDENTRRFVIPDMISRVFLCFFFGRVTIFADASALLLS